MADEQTVTGRYVSQAAPRAVRYVGDSRFDVAQARRAGVVAVGYTDGYDSADELRSPERNSSSTGWTNCSL